MRTACRSDRSMKYVLVFMSIFSLTSMLLSFKVVGTLHGQVKNSPLRMEEGQCKPVPAERLDGLAYICNGKGCTSSSIVGTEVDWDENLTVSAEQLNFSNCRGCVEKVNSDNSEATWDSYLCAFYISTKRLGTMKISQTSFSVNCSACLVIYTPGCFNIIYSGVIETGIEPYHSTIWLIDSVS